jgi:hypothetical protein
VGNGRSGWGGRGWFVAVGAAGWACGGSAPPPVVDPVDPVDSVDSAEDGPVDSAVEPRVPYHGLTCESGPRTWAANDPQLGAGERDWLVVDVACQLPNSGTDQPVQRCFAKRPGGGWWSCQEGWAARGHPAEQFEDAIAAAKGVRPQFRPAVDHPAFNSCLVLEAPAEYEEVVNVDDVGIEFTFNGIHHVACAARDAVGVWGGCGEGAVFMAVDPSRPGCQDVLNAEGWELTTSPDTELPVALVPCFRLQAAFEGTWAELERELASAP